MRTIALVLSLSASLAASGAARAQDPGAPAPRGVHTHEGFFLHMDLGFGAMSSTTSLGGLDLEASGGASQLSVAVGGAVVRNLVLAGHLWVASVSSPEVKLNGESLGAVEDATQTLTGVGLNVTCYLPWNVYLSATPSVGLLSVRTSSGDSAETENGFAFRLAVGKEWWLSASWGLGLALHFAHATNEAQGANPPTWTTSQVGLALSATYN